MNNFRLYFFSFMAVLALSFQSCNDDDDSYSLGDIAVDWATVVSETPRTYYLVGDTWGTMWPAATAIPLYNPEDGQRVMVVFNPLYDDFEGFDHAVKVEDVQEILTKDVEMLTEENNEEFGNDPIYIEQGNMWVSGEHLNIIFRYMHPLQQKHRVSLVTSALEVDAEGYIPVDLRYNTYQDTSNLWMEGSVSFRLKPLIELPGAKGIRLTMNSPENGIKELKFDF